MYEVDLSLEDPHGVNLQVSVHEVELPLRVSKDEVAAAGGGVSERRRLVTAEDLLNLASFCADQLSVEPVLDNQVLLLLVNPPQPFDLWGIALPPSFFF